MWCLSHKYRYQQHKFQQKRISPSNYVLVCWKGELFVGVIAAYNFQITFVIWLFIFVLQGDIYVFDLFQLIISDKIKELIQGVIATKI